MTRVREQVLPSITSEEPIQAWIIDDTGFPKKGSHSVGVGRQYCGQLGKQDNCQVAVSLSVATHQGILPIAYRLYLPKDRAGDPLRRAIAGVPRTSYSRPSRRLPCSNCARRWRMACRRACADRPGLRQRQHTAGCDQSTWLTYVAGISSTTMVRRPGNAPLPPASSPGRGRHAVAPRSGRSSGSVTRGGLRALREAPEGGMVSVSEIRNPYAAMQSVA